MEVEKLPPLEKDINNNGISLFQKAYADAASKGLSEFEFTNKAGVTKVYATHIKPSKETVVAYQETQAVKLPEILPAEEVEKLPPLEIPSSKKVTSTKKLIDDVKKEPTKRKRTRRETIIGVVHHFQTDKTQDILIILDHIVGVVLKILDLRAPVHIAEKGASQIPEIFLEDFKKDQVVKIEDIVASDNTIDRIGDNNHRIGETISEMDFEEDFGNISQIQILVIKIEDFPEARRHIEKSDSRVKSKFVNNHNQQKQLLLSTYISTI